MNGSIITLMNAKPPTFQTPETMLASIRPVVCDDCGGIWRDGRKPTSKADFTNGLHVLYHCGCTK